MPCDKYIKYLKKIIGRDVFMCRLGGVVLSKKERSEERITEITESLLMLMVRMEDAYGGDGSGVSFHWDDGRVEYLKDHRDVNFFFRHFNTLKNWLLEGATIVQLHARMSTGGSSENHNNLHPFTHGDIVGAHNGTIDDISLWGDLNPLGVYAYSDVDSEAIFASIDTFAPSLHPKLMQVVMNDLYGVFALSIWSKKMPNNLLLVKQDNPLSYWHDKDNGELWYASTGDLLPTSLDIDMVKTKATYQYGANKGKSYMKPVRNIIELREGDALYIRSGDGNNIHTEFIELDVSDTSYSGYGRYGGYSSYGYDYADYYEDGFTEIYENGEWTTVERDEGLI